MQDIFIESLAYFSENPIVSLVIALSAGFLATRIVASERRPGVIGFTIIGILGLFLAQLVILFFGLNEYLEDLHQLRNIVYLFAAFVGSFFIATIVHFIKPS
jgi:uncharacterized membrane protein YeaQ/YmgE (transglycosylase-associated protein family)